MLKLDYSLSSSWNESGPPALDDADETVLRYDCFLGDVIFMVYEVDLSARWGWVSVLDFALGLDTIVDTLDRGRTDDEVFEFTESDATITFRRAGDIVEIEASYVSAAARASYDDLRTTVKQFLGRVVDDLLRQHPELRRNVFIDRLLGSIGAAG